MLLGLVVVLVLSFGVLASAQLVGGSADKAIGVGEAQVGKPFLMATDGPNTFSCVGLMRYILRTSGVDADAPWVPEEYLNRYAPVSRANLQPGDIVIFPGWATMYAGNGMLLNANEVLGTVTNTPMNVAGVPLGIVRPPYGGQSQGEATQLPNDVADPPASDPLASDPLVSDPMASDPLAVDPLVSDPWVTDPLATDPLAAAPLAADPMAQPSVETLDPLAQPIETADPLVTEPVAVDPLTQF